MWSLQNSKGIKLVILEFVSSVHIHVCMHVYFSILFISLLCVGVGTAGRRSILDKNLSSHYYS